ncbi:lanthionine synthetase C family protein [Bradyrhizobium sp. HKCCYLRH1030]|uniref:lanthionine synthetase C family protein n=1 Tax=Bradyrhizobium sp. HKCCYLRH1030 TaxID=3420744 RepID=UPI003EB71C74
MITLGRHRPLVQTPWDEATALAAIEDIAADAIAQFDPDHFWPAHPSDDGTADGDPSFYKGAAGVIWALDYLHRVGATRATKDFRPVLPRLMERTVMDHAVNSPADYEKHGSLLRGEMGAALLAMRLEPMSSLADLVHWHAENNNELPIRELMWGLPGSMVAAVHMAGMTGEARWRRLFEVQAARLLAELEDTPQGPLWTQDLYGAKDRFLGPVHGFAGNVIPLLLGWDWLTAAQRAHVAAFVPKALAANAWRYDIGTTWGPRSKREKRLFLCQHCHGAPGMVTTFADAPFATPDFDALLLDGGRFTWAAGPLTKGSNLCHGTGGNGYAFLKLYRRTHDPVWLDRARQFAMTAIVQVRGGQMVAGRGRYSLWTGDVGLAAYLWDCITGEPRFPTIDVF